MVDEPGQSREPASVAELLESAVQVGLIDRSTEEELKHRLADQTPADAAQDLVSRGLLMPLQAELLLRGEARACVLAGRYRLLEKLGEGGMGIVYRAWDERLGRDVAIKVLPGSVAADEKAVARFKREAKALARVAHPNIVQAFDADEDAGRQFLVMEYVEGRDLLRVVTEAGRMSPTQVADFGFQAALALEHAHRRGLVHRDVKPGNLLLTADGRIKLLDLGLARFVQDRVPAGSVTMAGVGIGTPDYMAPEQFRDGRIADARSDIYSLGCTLYHLLTGHVPFPTASLSEKYELHRSAQPTPIEQECPEVPAGLVAVVQKMMAKRPDQRYQAAREVADALAPFVSSSSIVRDRLEMTASWQAIIVPASTRQRWRRIAIYSAVMAGAVLMGIPMWRLLDQAPAPTRTRGNTPTSQSSETPAEAASSEPTVVSVQDEVTVAKNGTGQFRTLREALQHVKPGQTVQIGTGSSGLDRASLLANRTTSAFSTRDVSCVQQI